MKKSLALFLSLLTLIAIPPSLAEEQKTEEFIMISVGSIHIPVPKINFTYRQISPSSYTLSWHPQNNTDSYKIEKLIVDKTATHTDSYKTKWKHISQQETNTLTLHHDLTSLELGPIQKFRLSSCDITTACTIIAETEYKLDVDKISEIIPQNIQLQNVTTTPNAKNRNFNNPYAYGHGYHTDSKHAPRNKLDNPTEYTAFKTAKTSRSSSNTDVLFSWSPVANATNYVVAKTIERQQNPSYTSFWKDETSEKYFASSTSFQYGGLREGTHHFVVYACNDIGFCGGASEIATTSVTVNIPANTSISSDNIFMPEVVEANTPFTISWNPPTDTKDLIGYQVKGELNGTLAQLSTTTRSLQRNVADSNGVHPLTPGRLYCYTVTPQYANGKTGYTATGKCIQIGVNPMLPAPENFSIVDFEYNPGDEIYTGHKMAWDKVRYADYYQLDAMLIYADGPAAVPTTWTPIYVGKNTYHRMLFTEKSTIAVRVSACRNDGECGIYNRIMFGVEQSDVEPSIGKTPSCLAVPETLAVNQPITVSWCPPRVQTGFSHYSLTYNDAPVDLTDMYTSNQALPSIELPALTQGSTYCYKVTAHFDTGSYEYQNDDPQYGCGQVDLANQPPIVIPTGPDDNSTHFSIAEIIASATAFDVDGNIAKVEFAVDSGPWLSDESAIFAKSLGELSVGQHVIKYRALDNSGVYSIVAYRGIHVEERADAIAITLKEDNSTYGDYNIEWNNVAGAVSYQLQRKVNTDDWQDITHINPTSYDEAGVDSGSYRYRVRACFATDDCTPYSGVFYIEVPDITPNSGIEYSISNNVIAGNMQYSADVSPSGAGSITIPLEVPPGINGLAPDLSLRYTTTRVQSLQDSQYRTGYTTVDATDYIGLGWRLAGLSSIHVCETTGSATPMDIYFKNKYWCLDGQRLIKTAPATGERGALFKTQNDQNLHIELIGSSYDTARRFIVTHPNGQVSQYGGDTHSTVWANIQGTPAAANQFAIRKITDVWGNEINFYHYADYEKNLLYPQYITYGQNQLNKIYFTYGYREDAHDTSIGEYVNGANIRMMTAMVMQQKSSTGDYQDIGKYILYHEHPGATHINEHAFRRLGKVQRCGYNNGENEQCYNPIEIDWSLVQEDIGSKPRYVSKITGSSGEVTEFEVIRLSSDTTRAYFTERPFGEGTLPPESLQTDATRVVAMHKDNGIGGRMSYSYAYQGQLIKSNETSDRDRKEFGFFAQRVIDQQTGFTTYIQNFVNKPYIGNTAAQISYTAPYSGSNDIVISKSEKTMTNRTITFDQNTDSEEDDTIVNYPHTLADTIYKYEQGQLLHIEQRAIQYSFRDQNGSNILASLVETKTLATTQTAGSAITDSSGAAIWGLKTQPTLSSVKNYVAATTTYQNRTDNGLWLLHFVSNKTTNYANTLTSAVERTVSYSATAYGDTTNVEVQTDYAGDTQLEKITTYGYNDNGLPNSITVSGADYPQRQTQILSYNYGSFPNQTRNSLNQDSYTTVDPRTGKPVSRTDINDVVSSRSYNNLGMMTTGTTKLGFTVTHSYEFCQTVACPAVGGINPYSVSTIISPDVPTQKKYYDSLGRVIRESIQGFSASEQYYQDTIYDDRGRVYKKSRPYMNSLIEAEIPYTTFSYDDFNRITRESYPDGSRVNFSYAVINGKMITTTTRTVYSAQGTALSHQIESINYDEIGRIASTTNAKESTEEVITRFDYYADGNTKNIHVNGHFIAEFEYDSAGNRTKLRDVNIGETTSVYNAGNKLILATNALNQTTTIDYDLLDRKISETYEDGSQSQWIYDSHGDVSYLGELMHKTFTEATQQTPSYSQSYSYHSQKRPATSTTNINIAGYTKSYSQSFSYDTYGRVESISWPTGFTVKNDYNAQGYLYQIKNNTTQEIMQKITAMDALNNLTSVEFGNGVITNQTYNPTTKRLERIYSHSNTETYQDNRYQWRSNGLLEQRKQMVNTNGSTEIRHENFTYDQLNRLTSATAYIDDWEMRYNTTSYDLLGNITAKSSDIASDKQVTNYQYGTSLLAENSNAGINAVTSATIDTVPYTIHYNSAGGITHYEASAGGKDRYVTWNSRGLPIAITKGDSQTDTTPIARDSFIYGPSLARFYKKSEFTDENGVLLTEHTFYGPGIEEVIPAAGSSYSNIKKEMITTSINRITTTQDSTIASSFEYQLKDHLGSTEMVLDEQGYRLLNMSFDAFGARRKADWSRELTDTELELLAVEHNVRSRRGFTGHEHLDRTGLIHMNGRIYDPTLARFLSPDPVVVNPHMSQAYNRYSYVLNNPLGMTDPSGFTPSCADEEECLTPDSADDSSDNQENDNPKNDENSTGEVSDDRKDKDEKVSLTIYGSRYKITGSKKELLQALLEILESADVGSFDFVDPESMNEEEVDEYISAVVGVMNTRHNNAPQQNKTLSLVMTIQKKNTQGRRMAGKLRSVIAQIKFLDPVISPFSLTNKELIEAQKELKDYDSMAKFLGVKTTAVAVIGIHATAAADAKVQGKSAKEAVTKKITDLGKTTAPLLIYPAILAAGGSRAYNKTQTELYRRLSTEEK